jgi:peptidoglycan hydrolase-like protein with peptidoglycan-binding domain
MVGRLLAAAFASFLACAPAVAQDCAAIVGEIERAAGDSRVALERVIGRIDGFSAAIAGPRDPPIDTEEATLARSEIDSYVGALDTFATSVAGPAASCGRRVAEGLAELDVLISAFEGERGRLDAVDADHARLTASGEPAMTAATMEEAERALILLGHQDAPADGRFDEATRDAIAGFQASVGDAPTGYLTAPQLAELTGLTEAPGPVAAEPPPAGAGEEACGPAAVALDAETGEAEALAARARRELDTFAFIMIGPREPPIDGERAARVAAELEPAIAAADAAAAAAQPACEPVIAALQRLSDAADRLAGLRDRAGSLDGEHAAIAAAERAMTRAEMEAVQRGLGAAGVYQGAIDAAFGPGTRAAIARYQGTRGEAETGFLTDAQIAALTGQPATSAPGAPVAEGGEPSAPAAAPTGALVRPADVAAEVRGEDEPEPPPILHRPAAGEDPFGVIHQRMLELVVNRQYLPVLSQQYRLFGAAYREFGAESPEMADAHAVLALAHEGLGELDAAGWNLDRALAVVGTLPDEGGPLRPWLLERSGTMALLAALEEADGSASLPQDAFRAVLPRLSEALAAAEAAGDAGRTDRILDRLAALHAAAGIAPQDPRIDERMNRLFAAR